jgi:hypothetical protein
MRPGRDMKKTLIWTVLAALVPVLLAACAANLDTERSPTSGPVLVEFDIRQDMDLIRNSLFGGPPQFAIWLEDPVSHRLQTVFVTYRSAAGDWVGKLECPAALPRWFEVFKEETGSSGLPSFDNPAPDAVTGATPKIERFTTSVEVEPNSRWICWIEMNLAGDFNEAYQHRNTEEKTIDVHFSGQPSLIYRGEFKAIPGERIVQELHSQAVVDAPNGETVQPVSDGVTTARNIFKSIEIRVLGAGAG